MGGVEAVLLGALRVPFNEDSFRVSETGEVFGCP